MAQRAPLPFPADALPGPAPELSVAATAGFADAHALVPRTNWSRNLRYSTDRVYAPTTIAEVQAIVRECKRLKPLGSRHCFNDIADSRDAQISLQNLGGMEIDSTAKSVTVGAGVAYGELAPVLDRAGFALANLASLPHISVGGTIATATHGSGVHQGNLATQVRALEIVTADGAIQTLSRERDHDLLKLAVVHLGALGILTRVTLDLVPRYDLSQVVYQNLSFHQLELNLDKIMSAGYSVSLFTDWQGNRATQVWIKDRPRPGATPPASFFGATLQTSKLHPVEGCGAENCTDQMGSVGPWHERLPHFKMGFTPSSGEELQTEYFVARADGYRAIRAVEQMRDSITPHLLVSELRTVQADDLPMSMQYRRNSLAIHFTWRPDEDVVRTLLPEIEARLQPFAARPHWGKIFSMDGARLQHLYPGMADFQQIARTLDPHGKFRNDYLERNLFGGA